MVRLKKWTLQLLFIRLFFHRFSSKKNYPIVEGFMSAPSTKATCDDAIPPKADSDDESPSSAPSKSRKRHREVPKTVASVLAAFESPPDLETMKTTLRKSNRSYQESFGDGFLPALDAAQATSDLMNFYRVYCDAKAVEIMGKCLLYYKQAHNFVYSSADDKIITRAACRPTKCNVADIKTLFDHYLRDLEQTHHYYSKRQPKPPAAKRAMLPYNAFVKEQWLLRTEEFKSIPTEQRFATVNKILTAEWKNPDTRQRYVQSV